MDVGREEAIAVGRIRPPGSCKVVSEGVEPNVQHVPGCVRNLDAPVERGTRDGEVAQRVLAEPREDLVTAPGGLNELRVLLDVRHELLLVSALFEKVALFLHLFQRFTTHRVHVVGGCCLGLRHESLFAHVVPPLVRVQVDVSGCLGSVEEFSARPLVNIRRGAVVHIVGYFDTPVEILKGGHVFVAQRDGRHAGHLSRLSDLLPVLIRARLEQHSAAVCAVVTCDHVCRYGLVRMTHVRDAVGIVNGGGNAKLLARGVCRGRVAHPFEQ
mmetsp:Transcript_20047/g.49901  ORF Transcript_20047/g.49901 Transcript_20047/m.49901 type:complete len:270 (-) Transcript_20047:690-1499(-)